MKQLVEFKCIPNILTLLLSIFLWQSALYAQTETKLTKSFPEKRDTLNGVIPISDSGNVLSDSIAFSDTIEPLADTMAVKKGTIHSPINYQAGDSIVYQVDSGKIILYNQAHATYEDFDLKSYLITFDQNTYELSASGIDSAGKLTQKPLLLNEDHQFDITTFNYNLKTQKGKVYEAGTEQDGAYIHMYEAKRNEKNEWYGKKTWFTTCNAEHPHFYIQSGKTQFIPDKVVVSGPANLVVADVPLPVFIPFGIYPLKKGAHSGVILPQFASKNSGSLPLGFGLENGGYYWAVNPKLALTFTGKIYSRGSWGITVKPDYNFKYKSNGSLQFTYFRHRPDLPEDTAQKASHDYSIDWTHRLDTRARPGVSFSAGVHAKTSSYNVNTYNTSADVLNTQLSSNINFARNFRGTPFSLSLSASHSQNLLTHKVNIKLPAFNFSISRIYPFKKKEQIGKAKWFEKISFSYNLDAANSVNTVDSLLFKKQTLQNMQYGIKHLPRIDFSTSILKYINLVPQFSYAERWYFKTVNKTWNPDTLYQSNADGSIDTINGRIETDTLNGFFTNRDFSTSITLSTKLYGIWHFKNKHILGLKHDFTPSISFTYKPDFGRPQWNYYKFVQSSNKGDSLKYSRFENVSSLYGQATQGRLGSLRLAFNNRLEIKVYSKKDSILHEKKISLLDNFNIGMGYNFAVDTLQLSKLDISATSSPFQNFGMTFRASFDPYTHDSLDKPINQFLINTEKKLLRLTSASVSFNGRISSRKNYKQNISEEEEDDELKIIEANSMGYYDFNSPWNIYASYNLGMMRKRNANGDTSILSANAIDAGIDFNLTPSWKFNINSGYNFISKNITRTEVSVIKDLHCWELRITWVPGIGNYGGSYMLTLQAKPGILQSLRLNKRALPGEFDF